MLDKRTYTDRQRALIDAIDRAGYTVMTVGPAGGDRPQRWFAYTVGLTPTRGWPELIIFGLDHDDMAGLLAQTVVVLESWDTMPHAQMALPVAAQSAFLRLRPLDRRFYEEHLTWANWFARYRRVPPPEALQVLWADPLGRFPGDAGCDADIAQRQKPLSAGLEVD